MEITLDQKDKNNASLVVNLVEADYSPKVDAVIKEQAKKAQLKGFRPGKVPPAVIKRMIGKQVIAEEVFNVINESLKSYIKENKLDIVGEPIPTDEKQYEDVKWDQEKEFNFSYDIGIIPEYKLDISSKLKVTEYEVEVSDKEIEDTTADLKKRFASTINPDVVEAGDIVTGDLVNGDFNKSVMLPTEEIAVKKTAESFNGLKVGDSVKIDLMKAFKKDVDAIIKATGLSEEEINNNAGELDFNITKITRAIDAEMNQDFFDKAFGPGAVKNEEEYKEQLTKVLQGNYKIDITRQLNEEIIDALVEKTKIELPVEFFKRWVLQANGEKLTPEKLDEDFNLYERELKWTIIKNNITDANEIKVEHEEIVEKATGYLQQYYLGGAPIDENMAPQFTEFVNKYLQEENGKHYMRIYEDTMTEKVLENIKGQISIKSKKVKPEEFKKIISKN